MSRTTYDVWSTSLGEACADLLGEPDLLAALLRDVADFVDGTADPYHWNVGCMGARGTPADVMADVVDLESGKVGP